MLLTVIRSGEFLEFRKINAIPETYMEPISTSYPLTSVVHCDTLTHEVITGGEKKKRELFIVVHTFNPNTSEGRQRLAGSLSLRPVWSTEGPPGWPGLNKETLSCGAYL